MNMHNNSLAIDIQNLSKTYSNGTHAIDNISLSIPQGSFFALLGANGAGKTTTIGILTDLIKKTSGTVKIFGIDIEKNFSKAKYNIGVVPQEFNFGFFDKVLDIVTTQAGYYGIPLKHALPKAKNILTKLGLEDKFKAQARTLSGGMKRRLMIARALVHEPRLLILDEPTASVDAQLRIGMWDYLKEINTKHNTSILLTTHYLEEAEQLCEKAAIIKNGKIVAEDTIKNLLASLEDEHYTVTIMQTSQNKTSNKKIIMTKKLKTNLENSPFQIKIKDDNTLDVVVNTKTDNLNGLIGYLSSKKINIKSIQTKGSRLETLFLNIIEGDCK